MEPSTKPLPSTTRVVGFAYLRQFMRPKTQHGDATVSTYGKNVDLRLINALLSTFALLLSLLVETVKDGHDIPAGLGNMLGAVSLLSIVVAVSITHALIGPQRHSSWQLWQPFLGGWRFVTVQSVAWTLLSVSLFLSGLALHPSFGKIYPSHSFPNVWTLACTMAILSEVLLVTSLPLFESPVRGASTSIQLRWNDVGTINIIVSVIALIIFFSIEKLRPLHDIAAPHIHKILLGVAGSCIVLAIALTHLIVGKMCHGSHWKWWQAFEGGRRFVLMQAASWCLFSLAVLAGAWSIRNTILHEGAWTLAGTLGFLSELLMVISIQFYLPSSSASSDATPGSMQEWLNNATLLGKRARRFLVTVLLFNVFFAPIMVGLSFAIPFLFASNTWVWGVVVTLAVAVYTPTFFLTRPHYTGAIESSKLRTSFLVEDIIRYFNGRLVKTAEIDPTKQYIFGYHPHGILPLAAMWATNSPSWKLFQSGRDTVTLIASHLFRIPVTREFLAAAGAREVSRRSFQFALGQGKSVVLVPGGMKEMQHSLSTTDEIVVYKSHKGFVRMAITHGVDLVPLFSFGETKLLDGAFPELQKFCWRNLGIPFPLFVGRWNLPVPRPHQMTILVGPAIPVVKNPEPTEEEVDAVWTKYFDAIKTMFEEHKDACGYPQSTLVFK